MSAGSDDDREKVGAAVSAAADLENRPTFALAPGDGTPKDLRIGPYQVLRRLGEGGMGSVYLAVRADQEFRKYVAIKVIRKGMDSSEIVSRFRRERQILAGLDHPNIAKLFDGGTTDDGLPYFVMEYIQGRPLHEYCDSHGLTVRERLLLFRSICSAVQYAHQNLVIHRDLKPLNILVTADGVPRLLDFGIAKLLNPDALSLEAPPTATEARVMTPAYASPEQVRGDPLTTCSDVYSLGVILYELLTGRHPYRMAGGSEMEVYRAVCEQEPDRPSTAATRRDDGAANAATSRGAASPRKLTRQLRGDLDNIDMMALRKEPQRRYPSVQALSDDIGRCLDGRAVSARKSTWSYRTGKYVRLHAAGVAAASVVLLLLVAFAVTASVQNARVRRERDAAEEVTKLLVSLFDVNDPETAKGETITAREILDRGARRIEGELKGQPEVKAQLLYTIGDIYDKLGLFDQAQPLLEESLRLRRGMRAGDDAAVAQGMRRIGVVLGSKGQYDEAEKLLREALAMQWRLNGNEHPDVAGSLGELAGVFDYEGRLDEAEALYREALALHRTTLGDGHPSVARDLNNLGVVLRDKGKLDEAEKLHREAFAIDRKALGEEHPNVAIDRNNLAAVLLEKGRPDEAEPLFRGALAINRKALGEHHPAVAINLANVPEALLAEGKPGDAVPLLNEVLAFPLEMLPADNACRAKAKSLLGACLTAQIRYPEAEKLLLDAYASQSRPGAAGAAAGNTYRRIVALYKAWGRPDRAEAFRKNNPPPSRA